MTKFFIAVLIALTFASGAQAAPQFSIADKPFSDYEAVDVGVRVAQDYFGLPSACTHIEFGTVTGDEWAYAYGASCKIWTTANLTFTNEAVQCAVGIHEYGHAALGLRHTATGVMAETIVEIPSVCLDLYPQPALNSRSIHSQRDRTWCRRNVAKCVRKYPKLSRHSLKQNR